LSLSAEEGLPKLIRQHRIWPFVNERVYKTMRSQCLATEKAAVAFNGTPDL
jgi:hypothetical protein